MRVRVRRADYGRRTRLGRIIQRSQIYSIQRGAGWGGPLGQPGAQWYRPARLGSMGDPVRLTDAADPRLADYVRLTDVQLRRSLEAAEGLFIAEGEKVIRRAIAAGYPLRSVLVADDKPASSQMSRHVRRRVRRPAGVAEHLTGFRVHRGALASMQRLPAPPCRATGRRPPGGRARGHR